MPTTTYSYPCPACGRPITPGDQVRTNGTSQAVHPGCSAPPVTVGATERTAP